MGTKPSKGQVISVAPVIQEKSPEPPANKELVRKRFIFYVLHDWRPFSILIKFEPVHEIYNNEVF